MDRCIFLDRDHAVVHPGSGAEPQRVRLVQGAAAAIASLRGLGYRVAVVSNQDAVAMGDQAEEDVQAVHQRIAELVDEHASTSIDRFYYCPYHPQAKKKKYKQQDHDWRLPKPGMLKQAAEDLQLNLAECWMVGDKPEDVEAGLAAGVRTILIGSPGKAGAKPAPDFTAASLSEAVRLIAQHHRPERQIQSLEKTHVPAGSVIGSVLMPPPPPAASLAETPAPPKTEPAPAPAAPPAKARPRAGKTASSPAVRPTPAKAEPEKAIPEAESPAPAEETRSAPPGSQTDDLLRQILQALRRQEADRDDFSPFKLAAGVVQMLTAICVLFGLFYASSDPAVFVECFLGAMVGQLLVLTLLVYHRLR